MSVNEGCGNLDSKKVTNSRDRHASIGEVISAGILDIVILLILLRSGIVLDVPRCGNRIVICQIRQICHVGMRNSAMVAFVVVVC